MFRHLITFSILALLATKCYIRPQGTSVNFDRSHLDGAKRIEKVISFSLYGNEPRYTTGALENAHLISDVYPGWKMRVYYDDSVPSVILQKLKASGVQLVDMTGSSLNKMNWRFLIASDASVDYWCSRDIDARLSNRESVCVELWLRSGRLAHVIRDHPSHTQVIPGGMWCAKNTALPNMKTLLKRASVGHEYNADQLFLKRFVWPKLRHSLLQHVSFACDRFPGSYSVPIRRFGYEHVGSVFINGTVRQIDIDLLKEAIAEGKECA